MISAFVITGFLGVGKTTMLINSVKEHFKDKNIAVVVNEFGDVGVDGEILKNVYSDVLEISEGCICCQLSDEFEKGVDEIIQKFNPEIIFIETSGASEPFPIYISLQKQNISVEGVICVIDSKNFDAYKENTTARHQIAGSNILVLNKTDLVDEDGLDLLEKEIRHIKEKHNLKNLLTDKPIFKNYVLYKSEQGLVDKKAFEGLYRADEVIEFGHAYKHHDHTSEDAISQKIGFIKAGSSFEELDSLLSSLPKNIYRVKGVVMLNEHPKPMFFNYAFGAFTAKELKDYDGESILIFIGENVQRSMLLLEKMFDALVVPKFSVSKFKEG